MGNAQEISPITKLDLALVAGPTMAVPKMSSHSLMVRVNEFINHVFDELPTNNE